MVPLMPPVQTDLTTTQNVWTCPTCRHGSSDPRDEAAHLDAHRQLGQFFQEWDAAVARDRDTRRLGRRLAVVLGVFVAIVAVVAGLLFWSSDGGTDGLRPAQGPSAARQVEPDEPVVPRDDPVSPAPEAGPAQPGPTDTAASPAAAERVLSAASPLPPSGATARPSAQVRATPDSAAEEPVTPGAPPAPATPPAAGPSSADPGLRLQVPHLHVCLLQVCLNVG